MMDLNQHTLVNNSIVSNLRVASRGFEPLLALLYNTKGGVLQSVVSYEFVTV
jgi:hypothetical protein